MPKMRKARITIALIGNEYVQVDGYVFNRLVDGESHEFCVHRLEPKSKGWIVTDIESGYACMFGGAKTRKHAIERFMRVSESQLIDAFAANSYAFACQKMREHLESEA